MTGRLLSFIENPVGWTQSEDNDDQITISGLEISTVRKATFGTGLFYFYDEGWNSQLSFLLTNPLNLTPGPGQLAFTINQTARFPCTGIITSSDEGYLIAPTIKLEIANEPSIVLMRLCPRVIPHTISIDKPTLSTPDQPATVSLSTQSDGLRCTGTVSGSNFESARLIINRNPNLPVYKSGYNEEVCKVTEPGKIDVTWKPVSKIFDDSLIAFYPSSIGATELDKLANLLGAPNYDPLDEHAAMVVGDGPFTDYKLRLVVAHHFHSFSDEVRLTVE